MTDINDETDKQIQALLIEINHHLSNDAFDKIDQLLYDYDPEYQPAAVSIALIRYTYQAKSILTNWNFCLNKIRRDFIIKELRPDRLLRGLI